MIQFDINIISYKRMDMVKGVLNQIGPTNLFTRVWDNSPTKWAESNLVDEYRWHRFNPSLSRVWNWAVAQSETEWVLVCSDDIKLLDGWYEHLCAEVEKNPDSLWHGPSRCFLFNKKLLQLVGWFDERLTGITYEDLDYIRRMNHAKVEHHYGKKSILEEYAVSLKGYTFADRFNPPVQNKEFIIEKYGNAESEKFESDPILYTPDFYPNRNIHLLPIPK